MNKELEHEMEIHRKIAIHDKDNVVFTTEEHDLFSKYVDRILQQYKANEITLIEAREDFAQAFFLMQNSGPRSALAYIKASEKKAVKKPLK